MTPDSPLVYLVVDANYGGRLRDLPGDAPAWIADTPVNQPVIQDLWTSQPADGTQITSFKVAPERHPEDWVLDIMETLELHHGEHSQTPPYSVLRVIGTPLTPRLHAGLGENGFARYEDSPDGFTAYKSMG